MKVVSLTIRPVGLVLTGSVDGGHESLDDGELVVEDLGEGSQAVGGAGSVGDDVVLGVVLVEVDTYK